MSTSTTVRQFFEDRLSATSLPGVDLVFQGQYYQKVAGTPWVRFTLLPAESEVNVGGNVSKLKGLGQFDVFYPPANLEDADVTVQSIIDAFKPAVFPSGGESIVIENVWSEVVREEQTYTQVPVMIRWMAFRLF